MIFDHSHRVFSMRYMQILSAGALAFSLFGAGISLADDAAEKYVKQAASVLHHSCASLGEESREGEARILKVIEMMAAISFYNREVDIADFARTDEEKADLKKKFFTDLKRGCDQDPDALLAGVVDRAVVYALTTE